MDDLDRYDDRPGAFAPVCPEGGSVDGERVAPTVVRAGLQGSSCPRGVPVELWEAVFPPDRDAIKEQAALLYRSGVGGTEALLQAQESVTNARSAPNAIDAEKIAHALQSMLGTRMAHWGAEQGTVTWGQLGARTARLRWREIMSAEDPVRACWALTPWRKRSGACRLTGVDLPDHVMGPLHPDFMDLTADIARAYCESVYEIVQSACVEPDYDQDGSANSDEEDKADPDDPSTWSEDYAGESTANVPVSDEKADEALPSSGLLDEL